MTANSVARFRVLLYLTILLTYLVILAGAVVRTTQSGMGCPDWPKCFGMWIPPTDVSQLPSNYQETYAHRGYADTGFDAYHTWVEYVNRLFGAVLGIVIFMSLIAAFRLRKTNSKIFALTLLAFILVGFQAWLGSLVVASNLAPVKITIHMIAALVLLALLIYIYDLVSPKESLSKDDSKVRAYLMLALGFTVIQVMLGTQVRQEVDVISKALEHTQRESWTEKLSTVFIIHRSFSILVLALNAWIIMQLLKISKHSEKIKQQSYYLGLLLTGELLIGFILSHFAFPAALQPAHLLFASLLFGVQFKLLLVTSHKN